MYSLRALVQGLVGENAIFDVRAMEDIISASLAWPSADAGRGRLHLSTGPAGHARGSGAGAASRMTRHTDYDFGCRFSFKNGRVVEWRGAEDTATLHRAWTSAG